VHKALPAAREIKATKDFRERREHKAIRGTKGIREMRVV
jgi:hypothetical protein